MKKKKKKITKYEYFINFGDISSNMTDQLKLLLRPEIYRNYYEHL